MSSKMEIYSKIICLVILSVGFLQLFSAANAENVYSEVESLTPSQRKTLDNLKISMSPVLPQDYMKEDTFLLRFLKFNNFNIPKSERQLKEMLKWRKDNYVEEMLANPPDYFKELQKEYPIYNDGFDKEGRPICEINNLGSWTIRAAAAAGHLKNVTLHLQVNCVERALQRIREEQAKGINVTQYIFLSNMDGFSMIEQACPSCIPLLVNLAGGNDKYFPNSAFGYYLVNTPAEFSTLFRLIRPVLSATTRSSLKIFTADESVWKPFLEKQVDFQQISESFGGGKNRRQ